jgi:hypothetical protein
VSTEFGSFSIDMDLSSQPCQRTGNRLLCGHETSAGGGRR